MVWIVSSVAFLEDSQQQQRRWRSIWNRFEDTFARIFVSQVSVFCKSHKNRFICERYRQIWDVWVQACYHKKTPLLAFPASQCLASTGRSIFFSLIVGLLRWFQPSHYLFSSLNVIEDGKLVDLCFSGCQAKIWLVFVSILFSFSWLAFHKVRRGG